MSKVMFNGHEVNVKEYLSFEEIEKIAQHICEQPLWSDRFVGKAYITLYVATDMSDEDIDSIDEQVFIEDKFMNEVYGAIKNYYMVKKAVNYYDSTSVVIKTILGAISELGEVANAEATEEVEENKE